ncbi:RepB family protein [Candidatus Pantoea multigeneris]|uniref:Protein CopB n=1 Tax=Candidatus Pantoea multigeneris TaxID=2608357 RepID=A0ABX0RHK2_9GAMM|nr:RepB family protein [Pantoea multigeneris]NIF23957.1 hypothetical protein [Pantoea multigeneris]
MSSEDKPKKPRTRRQQGLPPLTNAERKRSSAARKKLTHSEIKTYIPHAQKAYMDDICERRGITQSDFLTEVLERIIAEDTAGSIE